MCSPPATRNPSYFFLIPRLPGATLPQEAQHRAEKDVNNRSSSSFHGSSAIGTRLSSQPCATAAAAEERGQELDGVQLTAAGVLYSIDSTGLSWDVWYTNTAGCAVAAFKPPSPPR